MQANATNINEYKNNFKYSLFFKAYAHIKPIEILAKIGAII